MLTVREISAALEALAPPALAEGWDNVGLLVGDPAAPVTRVLTALDASAGVVAQADAMGAELLVVHHPLVFGGLKRVVEDGGTVSLVRRLVAGGRSLLALHTNLDTAPRGLNAHVADLLGLCDTRPLVPAEARPLVKLVVYVPEAQAEAVRAAICDAGAGHIGGYDQCTFAVPGTGTFRPGPGTQPFIGTPGTLERVPELRLETVVPRSALGAVLRALTAAHPYEEPAYDILPMDTPWPGAGLGRVGTVAPTTAGALLQRVRESLDAPRAALVGDPARPVRTVALVTGSGSDFFEHARRAGADLYLTGEVKHHVALLARESGVAVVDAGHFPTERPAAGLLAGWLRAAFSTLDVRVADEADAFAG
jgi:dinuclear metal center YbgI/SA1388 family protein